MNRVFAATASISRTCSRRLSTTEVRCGKPDLSKIKSKQLHFQADNDIPVYIKGGFTDYLLYYTTIGLIVVGFSASLHSMYNLATKK